MTPTRISFSMIKAGLKYRHPFLQEGPHLQADSLQPHFPQHVFLHDGPQLQAEPVQPHLPQQDLLQTHVMP